MAVVYCWSRRQRIDLPLVDIGLRDPAPRPASSLPPELQPQGAGRPVNYAEFVRMDEKIIAYVRANPGRTREEIAAGVGYGPYNYVFMDALRDLCDHDNPPRGIARRWTLKEEWNCD